MSAVLPEPSDTQTFGAQLGSRLQAGDLVVLSGPLGAGKTTLAQGIGRGLGVERGVVSPTFVIARIHRSGRVPLVHVDAYRLHSLAEVDDLDLDVDLADSVTLVEWGSGLVEQLADSYLHVQLARVAESDERTVTLAGHGGDWAARLAEVARVDAV